MALLNRKRICVVTAAEITVTAFLLDHLRALSREYATTLITNTADPRLLERRGIDAELVDIAIQRKPCIGRDAVALTRLAALFARRRFELVHSVNPKAGMLTMIAGAIARVPVRMHTFTGQVWATKQGAARTVLKSADRFIASAATTVLADSPSQRDFLVSEGVVTSQGIRVLGAGSISGVDLGRFRPDLAARRALRSEYGIPEQATVFLFIGRLNHDKGVLDLSRAFSMHASRHEASVLLVVGPDEEEMRPKMQAATEAGRVVFVAYTPNPERFMAAADVLCLPSYREGFGTVIIEAAAVGLPAIASRIYGLTDAVVDRVTGMLHAPRAPNEIASAMDALSENPGLVRELGTKARARAQAEFSKERVTSALVTLYAELLG
jgi:glycosyltransferase involved in cell wall biosynthesis